MAGKVCGLSKGTTIAFVWQLKENETKVRPVQESNQMHS
jgi:hypothetical protein